VLEELEGTLSQNKRFLHTGKRLTFGQEHVWEDYHVVEAFRVAGGDGNAYNFGTIPRRGADHSVQGRAIHRMRIYAGAYIDALIIFDYDPL
jgi:hypothetical protein